MIAPRQAWLLRRPESLAQAALPPSAPRRTGAHRRLLRNPDTGLHEPGEHRVAVHASPCALVEDASIPGSRPPPSGYEERFQVIFPYWGLFEYSVGGTAWLVDPNQILFVTPGSEFKDAHPVPGTGHAAMIVNPAESLLQELVGRGTTSSPFERGSRQATRDLLLLGARLRSFGEEDDPLLKDEWTIHAIREAMDEHPRRQNPGPDLVRRAKEFLHAHSGERLPLDLIARAVGTSPVYLSQEFTRTQGVPLYRYLMGLRLSRALLELPHCSDITGLAVYLGFSSHSHFSSTFKRYFAMTPAEFRAFGAGGHLHESHSAVGRWN